jgi:hypothetical protein
MRRSKRSNGAGDRTPAGQRPKSGAFGHRRRVWWVETSGHRWAWYIWALCALVVTAAAALSGCVFDSSGQDWGGPDDKPGCPGLWCTKEGVCQCGPVVSGPDASGGAGGEQDRR